MPFTLDYSLATIILIEGLLIIFQFEDHTITSIFSRIVLWHLDTKGFAKEFDPCIDQIVTATLEIHKFVVGSLLPTPDHSHYLFSLKEFSRVICGCLLSVPETMEDLNAMKRLWVHEVFRVYYDRLTTEVRLCLSFEIPVSYNGVV